MKSKRIKNALLEVRDELLKAIENGQNKPSKQVLKSSETRKVLGGISAAKLQYLRISGKLPAINADGMWLYDYDDILEFIESNKNSRREVRHG